MTKTRRHFQPWSCRCPCDASGNLLVVKLWILFLCAAIVASAATRTIEIPALSFGKTHWSVIKLTNPAAVTRVVTLDVYRQNGDKLPLGGEIELKPRETTELRIEAESAGDGEMCWARL